VLAYLAADNDLEVAAIADIKEMERVGSRAGQVEIVVQVDRGASDDRPTVTGTAPVATTSHAGARGAGSHRPCWPISAK